MRILVLPDSTAFGGIGRYCVQLVSGLQDLGVDASLAAFGHPETFTRTWLVQQAEEAGLKCQLIPMRNRYDLSGLIQLLSLLKDQAVDIVHSQSYKSNILSRLAIKLGRLNAKSVVTLHAVPRDYAQSLPFRLDMWTSRWSTYAIAVDEGSRRDFREHGLAVPEVTVIHNGIPLTYLNNSQEQPKNSLLPVEIVVGFVGRLTYQKNIQGLVELIRRILTAQSNVGFVVVGDGPDRVLLEPLLEESYGDRLLLTGQVKNVMPFYKSMDLLVMPSRYEGLSFVALEAMANGLPIIASAVGGMPEVITNGEDGILVDEGDIDAMVAATLALIADNQRRVQLGSNARKTVFNRFSQRTMCLKTLEIYRTVLETS